MKTRPILRIRSKSVISVTRPLSSQKKDIKVEEKPQQAAAIIPTSARNAVQPPQKHNNFMVDEKAA